MSEEIGDEMEQSFSDLRLVPAAPQQPELDSDVASDDEDDDEQLPVIVGFVQKPERPWSLARQLFPSKAGGTPAWLDPVNLPRGKDICCGICEKQLQFLLQVYAPIEGKDEAFHRTLFVFMCPNMACLQQDQHHQMKSFAEKSCRSVKVFRCQLGHKNSYYSKDPPKYDGHDAATSKGVALCSWCSTWRGEKVCAGCKATRYCSRDHQLEHWRESHAAFCRKVQANMNHSAVDNMQEGSSKGELGVAVQPADAEVVNPACKKMWPEFEIVDEEEDSDEQQTSIRDLAITGNGKDDDISRQFQEVEPSKEQQHWASFQARLSRAPGQVIRYCRSGKAKPLWSKLNGKPDPTSVPVCPSCNEPRIFEFQVLSQLLYFFGISNEPDSLAWGTIAVYTCESSCISSKAYMEEFAWVQLE